MAVMLVRPAAYLLLIGMAASGCSDCPSEIISEVASPDGRYFATVYTYNCGPMTPSNRLVSIRRSDDTVSTDAVITIREIQLEPVPSWRSANELLVTIDCKFDTRESCVPPDGRGAVNSVNKYEAIHITREAGPTLKKLGLSNILEQLDR